MDTEVHTRHQIYWNGPISSTPSNSSEDLNVNNVTLLSLKRIEYSSKYSGSIILIFQPSEKDGHFGPWVEGETSLPDDATLHPDDFGIEAFTTNYAFDLQDLEARIYVTPRASAFNPMGVFTTNMTDQHAEIDGNLVGVYKAHPISTLVDLVIH